MINADRIHAVIAELSHRLMPEEVADGVVLEATRRLGARGALVALFTDDGKAFGILKTEGYPESALARIRSLPPSDMPFWAEVHAGESIFIPSRVADPRSQGQASTAPEFGDGATAVLPLRMGDQTLGVLVLSFDVVRELSAEERLFLTSLANQCANTLARARALAAEKAARFAAEQAERRLSAILEQLPEAVTVLAADGKILLANSKVASVYGKRAAAGTNRQDYPRARLWRLDGQLCAAEDLPIFRALRGQSIDEECWVATNDDERRRLRVRCAPIRDEDGAITSAVASFTDVTKERSIEEALRVSEERHRAVLDATNDVIWEWNRDHDRIEWSQNVHRTFGWHPDDPNLDPKGAWTWWQDRIHPDDVAALRGSFDAAAHERKPMWSGEYRFRCADGSYLPMLDRCLIHYDEKGEVVRLVGAMLDVSERDRLIRELREAVHVRDDFLSIAGHELRTPLTALAAQLLGLQRMPLTPERSSEKLEAASRQVTRLTRLVNQLLDVSRITAGRLRLELEDLDLVELVREVAARSGDELARAKSALEIVTPDAVVGKWDRLRIEMVVGNLISNAARYGEARPIAVEIQTTERTVRILVRDHGIGIHPEDQARIFERFERAVSSRKFPGLGLGLWLVRQVVEAHGGQISVESVSGEGTTFTVELPR